MSLLASEDKSTELGASSKLSPAATSGMSAVKLHHQPPFAAFCTLRRSVLTVAVVTLLSFTYISLKSLHSPSLLSSPATTSTLQPSPPEDVDYGVAVERGRNESDDAEEDDVYHLPKVFRLNYEEMLKRFKVYVYSDGDPKTYYQTPRKLTGKYASEGYFFQNLRDS